MYAFTAFVKTLLNLDRIWSTSSTFIIATIAYAGYCAFPIVPRNARAVYLCGYFELIVSYVTFKKC